MKWGFGGRAPIFLFYVKNFKILSKQFMLQKNIYKDFFYKYKNEFKLSIKKMIIDTIITIYFFDQ